MEIRSQGRKNEGLSISQAAAGYGVYCRFHVEEMQRNATLLSERESFCSLSALLESE